MSTQYIVKEVENKYQVRQIDGTYDFLYSEWKDKEIADYECIRLNKTLTDPNTYYHPYIVIFAGKKGNGLSESTAKIEVNKRKYSIPYYNWTVEYYGNNYRVKGELKEKEF